MARAVIRAGVPSRYGNNNVTQNESQVFVPGPALGGILPSASSSASAVSTANSTGLLQQNITTPNGNITVNYAPNAGKYLPVSISKNVTFSMPVNQTSNNTIFEGTQNYTYAIENNSLIQVPTSNNINVSYNANPQILSNAQSKLSAATAMLNSTKSTLTSYQNALKVQGQAPQYYNYYAGAISTLLFPNNGPAKGYNAISYYENEIQQANQTIAATSPVLIGNINNGLFNPSKNMVNQHVYGEVGNQNRFLGTIQYTPEVSNNVISLKQTGFVSANIPISGQGYYGSIATAYNNGEIIISPKNFTSLTANTQNIHIGQETLSYTEFPTGFGISKFSGVTNGLVGAKNIPVSTSIGTVIENFNLKSGFTLGSGLSQITSSGLSNNGQYSLTQKVLVNSQNGEVTLSAPSGTAGQLSLGNIGVTLSVNEGVYSFSQGFINMGNKINLTEGNKEYELSINNGTLSENVITTTQTSMLQGTLTDLGPQSKTNNYGIAPANNIYADFGSNNTKLNPSSIGSLNNPNAKNEADSLLNIYSSSEPNVVLTQKPNAEYEYLSLMPKNGPIISFLSSEIKNSLVLPTTAVITTNNNGVKSTTTEYLGLLNQFQLPFQTFFVKTQTQSSQSNTIASQIESTGVNVLTQFGQIGYNFVYGSKNQKLLSVGEVAAIATISVAGPAIGAAFGIGAAPSYATASGVLSVPIGEMSSFSETGKPETLKQVGENAVLSAAGGYVIGAAGDIVSSIVTPKVTNIDVSATTLLSDTTRTVELSSDMPDQPFISSSVEGEAVAYKTTDIVGGPRSTYTRTVTMQSPIRNFFRMPSIIKTDVVQFSSDIYVNNDVAAIVSKDTEGNSAVGIARATGKVQTSNPQQFIMNPQQSTSTDLANYDFSAKMPTVYRLQETSITTFEGSQTVIGNKVSVSIGPEQSNLITYTSEPIGSLQLRNEIYNVEDTVSNVRLTIGSGKAIVNGDSVPVTFRGISGIYSTSQLPNEFSTGAIGDVGNSAIESSAKLALSNLDSTPPQITSTDVIATVPHAFEPKVSSTNGGSYVITSGRSSLYQISEVAVKPLVVSSPSVSTINIISPTTTTSTLIYNNKDPLILSNKNYSVTSFAGSSIMTLAQTTSPLQSTQRLVVPITSGFENSTINRAKTINSNTTQTLNRQTNVSLLSQLQGEFQTTAQVSVSRNIARQSQRQQDINANGENAGQFALSPNIISPIPIFGIGSRIKNTNPLPKARNKLKSVNFKYFADFSHSELGIHGKATKIGLSRPIARGRKK